MNNLIELPLDIIIQSKKLSVYFQPIVENNGHLIFGYEALIRGPINSSLHSPIALFETARQQGRLVELELLCRELSIIQFDLPEKLFLNARQKALEFIITHNGEYQGVGSVIDLLKEITHLQINNARYVTPLTLLPGNVPISKELDKRLKLSNSFVICYINLDNFKPYNDHYGYEKGDQIILGLANIIQQVITHSDDFIGHIGGDDFIMILSTNNWHAQCVKILDCFSEWVRHRYTPEHQVMGGITGEDRAGKLQSYPLLTLSIGCVNLPPPICNSHHDVAVLASYAKSMAKKIRGNALFVYDASTQ